MRTLLSSSNRSLVRQLLSRSFGSADEAAVEICRLVRIALEVDLVFVSAVDGEQVEMLAVDDGLGSGLVAGARLDLGQTFCERALNGTAPQTSADLADGPYADLPWPGRLGVRSYAMSPLWDSSGQTTGTLSVLDRRSRAFDQEELGLLELLGGLLSRERELDRVRAREAARAAQVEASERRYRSLVDDLGDLVVEADATGGFTYVNRAFTELTGVSLDDMSEWGLMDRVHPDDHAVAQQQVAAALSGVDTTGQDWAREIRFLVPDGSVRWMSVRGRPVFADGGALAGFRGILHDVTVRVEAEQQVRAALADAEAARDEAVRLSRAKSEFLSRMSHELRTPLNAILGFGQLLELGELVGEDAENVEQILRAGRHLLDLINEVLDVVRIESGALGLSLEPVEVGDVVAESLDLVRTAAVARGITVRTPDRFNGAAVVADRQRFKQVLVNLLSNAVKYNRDGGSIEVRWALPATGGTDGPAPRLRLTVTDTGHGIPADRLDDVFTPFDRLGAEGTDIEGTGVGLSLTRTLVEAQDGTIGVLSEVGTGSTFWVELPAGEPVRAAGSAQEDEPEAQLVRTVLYVEDNPSNITLVRRVLARRPHVRLVVVQDGAEAVEAAADLLPDLVLLDLHLPGLPGSGVLTALRGSDDARLSKVPVVIVTADLTSGTERRMLEAGATLFLPKPIDVRQLLAVVDDHLPPA
ncbi:ATP-binding protein [Geodermatophilus sp. DSM 45219]|uniref:hybrid sensor histidine kinase/response regulator n=1 Tax=Geodermatophilus sp. DSM 45219 TaxID=1881103 RepID=UPI00088C450B|nr:ATP-binding protein [Geodermatophilus sp. DSM 45219]SDN98397.1 PAS domain S-box-containing protein [Geodermatophilus sp. DSM 45219]